MSRTACRRMLGDMELYLLELAGSGATGRREVDRMCRALQRSVARYAVAGEPVRWVGGLLLPDAARCLCLLSAPDSGHVVRARDAAGLAAVRVHRALPTQGVDRRAAGRAATTVATREENHHVDDTRPDGSP